MVLPSAAEMVRRLLERDVPQFDAGEALELPIAVATSASGEGDTKASAFLDAVSAPGLSQTAGELIDGFLGSLGKSTRRAYASDLRQFARHRGVPLKLAVDELVASDFAGGLQIARGWLASMRGLSLATRARRASLLCSLTRYAFRNGLAAWTFPRGIVEG